MHTNCASKNSCQAFQENSCERLRRAVHAHLHRTLELTTHTPLTAVLIYPEFPTAPAQSQASSVLVAHVEALARAAV